MLQRGEEMSMVELVTKLLIKVCEKTGRVFHITGTGDDTPGRG